MTKEAVKIARQSLLEALTSNDRIEEEVARLISDDIAHSRLIREKAAIAAESLTPTDTTKATLTMRALTAYSIIIRNTADALQNDLRMSGASVESMGDDLPELIIHEMTAEEIKAVRDQQKKRGIA